MSLRTPRPRATRGFTLVEVMVSLIVISVGLLGIASMEGLALSSTGNARMRALASIEAAGLAATMHTNRAFWSVNSASVTINGSNSGCAATAPDKCISSDSTADLTATGVNCTSTATAPCTPQQLAAYDTQNWITSLNELLPSPTASISCPNGTPPLTCLITISWSENAVNISASQRAAASAASSAPGFENNSYTLYVQP